MVMRWDVLAVVGDVVCGLGVGGKTFHILLGSENRALCEISIAKGPGGIRTPSGARALERAVPGAVGANVRLEGGSQELPQLTIPV